MSVLLRYTGLVSGLLLVSACGVLPLGEGPEMTTRQAAAPAKVQARFERGLVAMEAQRWDEALPEMEALWEDYPWYSGPALNSALMHQRALQPDLAQIWFQRALEANGENLEAHNAFAIFLREQGRYSEAEAQYQAALQVSEEHAATHYNLGILYDLYLGEKASALAHFHRYQELTGQESRQVAGWIADLQRQLPRGQAASGGAS